MRVIVFGATGSIGRLVVKQALKDGNEVIAFARNPHVIGIEHKGLTKFEGDVYKPSDVSLAVKGCDAVCIALGSKSLKSNVRSVGTQHIVDAMQDHNVKRLICQSTLGVGESRGNLNFFWKCFMFGLVLRHVYKDHVLQEQIVKQTDLEWVIVHPAAFVDEVKSTNYKHGFPATEKNLQLKIARTDVANFILKQLESNAYLYKTPGLSY